MPLTVFVPALVVAVILVLIGILSNWPERPVWVRGWHIFSGLAVLIVLLVFGNWYFGQSQGTASAPPLGATPAKPANADGTPFNVPSDRNVSPVDGGFDSGIPLKRGDTVQISAHGTVQYGYEGGEFGDCKGFAITDPDGNRTIGGHPCGKKNNEPLSNAPVGALIGRVGNGQWFLIGSQKNFHSDQDGNLWLAPNNFTPTDNRGSYTVTVRVSK